MEGQVKLGLCDRPGCYEKLFSPCEECGFSGCATCVQEGFHDSASSRRNCSLRKENVSNQTLSRPTVG